MKRHYSILIEAVDMPEEKLREIVDRMLQANAIESLDSVRFRVASHSERPEVVKEEILKRMEKALWLIENIQNF